MRDYTLIGGEAASKLLEAAEAAVARAREMGVMGSQILHCSVWRKCLGNFFTFFVSSKKEKE